MSCSNIYVAKNRVEANKKQELGNTFSISITIIRTAENEPPEPGAKPGQQAKTHPINAQHCLQTVQGNNEVPKHKSARAFHSD